MRSCDRLVFLSFLFMWFYIMYNMNQPYNIDLPNSFHDCVFATISCILLWFCMRSKSIYYYSHKRINRLCSWYGSDHPLEYKPTFENGRLKHLEVRILGGFVWYDIDYDLTIGKNSSVEYYKNFISNTGTIGKLLSHYNHRLRDNYLSTVYECNLTNRRCWYFFGTLCLLVLTLIIWFNYYDNIMSYRYPSYY